MTTHEGAAALTIMRGKDGSAHISVDSLVDMCEDMAQLATNGGPVRRSFETLISAFRPMSTYEGMQEVTTDDGSQVTAYHCPTCRAPIAAARRIGGEPILIDVEPAPSGAWFPLRITSGVPTVAPYRDALDGAPGTEIRLNEHACDGQS